jgi:protein-L-isoaspartate(D-aspartate) O-methyltransferase
VKITYAENRKAKRMVRTQIQPRGIRDEGVLEAMSCIPRHRFVSGANSFEAYGDYPLSIGRGQTISQPYMVALMSEEMRLGGSERVLEIGTGSGYQTAILAELAAEVYTVELIPELIERSRKLLDELGYTNISYRCADGSLGWPEYAPYDRILVAAAAPSVPPPLTSQLADNGILVIPVGDSRHYQTLLILRRTGNRFDTTESIGCRFVPLVRKDKAY